MVMSRTTNQRDRYDVTKTVSPKIKYNVHSCKFAVFVMITSG